MFGAGVCLFSEEKNVHHAWWNSWPGAASDDGSVFGKAREKHQIFQPDRLLVR
jgi:hypothetical protein